MFKIINRPKRFDLAYKPTREGPNRPKKTTTPYKKMSGRFTHRDDEMSGQRQISQGHLFLFKYRLVGLGLLFSPAIKKKIKIKGPKVHSVKEKKAEREH